MRSTRLFRSTALAVAAAFCIATHAASVAPVAAENGMVVTAQHLATEVGVDVLKKGGNAVDAAVAVGYALAVVYPNAGNIGGGGCMTVRMQGGPQPRRLPRRRRAWLGRRLRDGAREIRHAVQTGPDRAGRCLCQGRVRPQS